MTADVFEAVLRAHQEAKPFHVFTVEMITGRRVEVDHPGAMFVRDGVAVFIGPGGVPHWFDHTSVNQIITSDAGSLSEPPDTPAA
jgi:hypothetical protein